MKKPGILLALCFATAMPAWAGQFAKGADIGWLQQMEATGYRFRNAQGEPDDALRILKDHGIDTIRLRTWVTPSEHRTDGHNSKEETVAMAVRAQRIGPAVAVVEVPLQRQLGRSAAAEQASSLGRPRLPAPAAGRLQLHLGRHEGAGSGRRDAGMGTGRE
jgi:hypothetical protein